MSRKAKMERRRSGGHLRQARSIRRWSAGRLRRERGGLLPPPIHSLRNPVKWHSPGGMTNRLKPARYFLYSRMSPGWQSKALQIASNVEKRMALAFPFFRIERLAMVIPTFSVNSVTLIFRFASITSICMIIAMMEPHTVKSFSDLMSTASWRSF